MAGTFYRWVRRAPPDDVRSCKAGAVGYGTPRTGGT